MMLRDTFSGKHFDRKQLFEEHLPEEEEEEEEGVQWRSEEGKKQLKKICSGEGMLAHFNFELAVHTWKIKITTAAYVYR